VKSTREKRNNLESYGVTSSAGVETRTGGGKQDLEISPVVGMNKARGKKRCAREGPESAGERTGGILKRGARCLIKWGVINRKKKRVWVE